MSQPPWMAFAWPELGQRETPGRADNPRILALFRDAGAAHIEHDETAWCAAFVGACLARAGQPGSGSLLARSYLDWGVSLDEPRLGAVAVLTRGADPSAGHVGFWLGETEDGILLLGGNQSDAVCVAPFAKQRLIGLRWPAAAASRASIPAADTFEPCLAHVLAMEGGWSNDPHDPGGPTNRGVTLAVFARHCGIELSGATRNALIERLRKIDGDTVSAIYRQRYWQPCRAEDLPAALALMHFDAAVNHGVAAAALLLQRTLGVAADGDIGPVTLAAARRTALPKAVSVYADLRRARYRALPHFWRFGRGWLARVDATLAAATAQFPDDSPEAAKTRGDEAMSDASQLPDEAPVKWWGNSLTIWGALITGATTVLPVLGPLVGLNITGELARQLGDQAVVVGQAVGGLAGTIMTIWGRGRASSRLGRREVSFRL